MNKIISKLNDWTMRTSQFAEDIGRAGIPLNTEAWDDNEETSIQFIEWLFDKV